MKYAAKVLTEKEALAWGLPPMMTEYIPDRILNIEGKWGKEELQSLCAEYLLDPYGNKDLLVQKLLYIGALDQEGQLTELPVQMSEAGHILVAPYLIGPPKKFCCRICGECAPPELLKEGMFQERIQWLREHYKKAHPGKWGRRVKEQKEQQTLEWLKEQLHGLRLAPQPSERKPRELETFKGYTVDHRLKEFRKAEAGKTLEFIPFDSKKGQELLKQMLLKQIKSPLVIVPQTFQKFEGKKFPLGQLVMTRGVADRVATDGNFAAFCLESLKRHANGDWGDLCEEDKKENEYSLDKHLRLFSAYEKKGMPKIWLITEADRSVTTTLFPDEY
jgi:hypothetical protein